MKERNQDLTEIIKENPGSIAIIDNDQWTLWRVHPDCNPFQYSLDQYIEWERNNFLADDTTIVRKGDEVCGSGSVCGGDILQALAEIVGIKIESV